MAISLLNFKPIAAACIILMTAVPAKANDLANALLQALPTAGEGWSLQTGNKAMDADGVKAFGMYSSTTENRLFVIEVDAGGQIVDTMATGWDHLMLTSETVEYEGVPFQIGEDGFTGLIDKKILIRAYGPQADEREVIQQHLDGLDFGAIQTLADQLQ